MYSVGININNNVIFQAKKPSTKDIKKATSFIKEDAPLAFQPTAKNVENKLGTAADENTLKKSLAEYYPYCKPYGIKLEQEEKAIKQHIDEVTDKVDSNIPKDQSFNEFFM